MTNPQTERTPLPYPQFFILLCIRFIEPISFTLIFPFVYFMVQDFNVTDNPNQTAFYAGFVSSAFAFGECFSGIPWGMVSDRIGRKPVIMMGLFGMMISMFAFGLSKSLAWAIVTRFVGGALNGNVGVIKSMVGEMTDRTNRATGFSYLAMVFGLGTTLGPALGGFLTHPVKNFPYFFGGSKFLAEYPYFLPCGICCIFDAFGILFTYMYLEETLKKAASNDSPALLSTSLLDPAPGSTSYGSVSTAGTSKKNSPVTLSNEIDTKASPPTISEATWLVIVSYVSLSLLIVMLSELFPFWAATAIQYGGLGYKSSDIGFLSSIMGLFLVFIQIFLYPSLQQRFTTLDLYRFSFILTVPVMLLLPTVSSLISQGFVRSSWWVLLFLMILRTYCVVSAFTSFNILLPESCEAKNILGQVNGIAQALGSFMRGIGPSLCGALWSWSLTNGLSFPFDYHLSFYVISIISIITLILVNRIRPETLIY